MDLIHPAWQILVSSVLLILALTVSLFGASFILGFWREITRKGSDDG